MKKKNDKYIATFTHRNWGIPPQIILIYTTMSPILFIFGPKIALAELLENPKKFWPRTPRAWDMAIWNFQNLGVP